MMSARILSLCHPPTQKLNKHAFMHGLLTLILTQRQTCVFHGLPFNALCDLLDHQHLLILARQVICFENIQDTLF